MQRPINAVSCTIVCLLLSGCYTQEDRDRDTFTCWFAGAILVGVSFLVIKAITGSPDDKEGVIEVPTVEKKDPPKVVKSAPAANEDEDEDGDDDEDDVGPDELADDLDDDDPNAGEPS